MITESHWTKLADHGSVPHRSLEGWHQSAQALELLLDGGLGLSAGQPAIDGSNDGLAQEAYVRVLSLHLHRRAESNLSAQLGRTLVVLDVLEDVGNSLGDQCVTLKLINRIRKIHQITVAW